MPIGAIAWKRDKRRNREQLRRWGTLEAPTSEILKTAIGIRVTLTVVILIVLMLILLLGWG